MSFSELVADLQVALNAAVRLEKEFKDKKLFNDLKEVLKTAKQGFAWATGKAVHELYATRPNIDTVKQLIRAFPDALSYKNEIGLLPVQSVLGNFDAVKYLTILAKEGSKLDVGGAGTRGGLLLSLNTRFGTANILQCLFTMTGDPQEHPILNDSAHLEVMKELRKDNILLIADIKHYHLLLWSCQPSSMMRFEYLVEWDPDCLMAATTNEHLPLGHAIIKNWNHLECFTMYFRTALKCHPKHLGFLFQKDSSGKTAYERAIVKYGEDDTFNVIKHCIPTDTKLPILHHVVRDAPQYMNDFSLRYPSAWYLRDEDGRTFKQAALASGSKTSKNDGQFFGMLTDDEIAELDPITNQYPFLTCAACENSDLSTVYALLSRNPSLIERYIERTAHQFAEEARTETRKRKRESDDDDDDNEV